MKPDIRMAIIRPVGYPVSLDFYNSQEIGLARGLSLCGVNVDVYVAGRGSGVDCRIVSSRGKGVVRLLQVPFFRVPVIDHALYPKLGRMLREGKYDFIQVNEENELTSFFVAQLARRMRIPVVVYQGMYQQLTGRLRAAFQTCYDNLLLPSFRKSIAKAIAKTTRARLHLERKGFTRTVTIPVGLDPTPFEGSTQRNWREELGIGPETRLLLYVGIFERRRNIDFMVDIAKKVADDRVVLVMAGTGPEHERIAARVAEESITNVRLAGKVPQEDLPGLYREADLFLLPSNYEIYGMVLLEAMFFGLPAISTRTAGPEDIIEHGVDGFLIDGLEPEQWLRAIRETVRNPEKHALMRQAAETKVKGSLLWEGVATRYLTTVITPSLAGESPVGTAATGTLPAP